MERNASLFFPAVLRPTQAQTPSVSPLYLRLQSRGLSRGSRAPSLARRHSPQPVPLRGHRRNQSAPGESPCDPWKPLPQRTHHRQNPRSTRTSSLRHPGNPRIQPCTRATPAAAPGGGAPPGPRQPALRRRHPRPRPGSPHSLTSPLGRQTQRRAAPRREGRPGPLPSSGCLRDAPRSAALPALRPRGHTPYQPEATASSRAWGSLLPGGQAVHMATLRATGGEETPAGRGEQGTGSGRGQGVAVQPRGPSGANMAGGGGVSRSRRGRGSCGRRTAHRGRGHRVLVPGFLLFISGSGS